MNRRELHNLVWTKPITEITKQVNLEEYTLRKIIKDHNIPKPKSGYWRKLKIGEAGDRDELNGNLEEQIDIEKYRLAQNNTFRYRTEKLRKMIEAEYAQDLIVPKKLKNKHPLIIRAYKELKDSSNHWNNRLVQLHSGYLSIAVQKENISRFLRIIETFITLLEKRGHSLVSLDSKYTYFNISDQRVKLKFREKCDRRGNPDSPWHSTMLVPSNKLSIRAEIFIDEKHWTDGYDPLEMQIAKIIAYLEIKVADHKIQREQWRIESEKHKHEVKLEELEEMRTQWQQAKVEKLIKDATLWKKNNELFAFLNHIKSNGSNSASIKEWVMWAEQEVIQRNPMKEGIQNYVNTFEFDEDSAKKELGLS